LILPTEHGQYPGPFPQGNGTIATITFKEAYTPLYPESAASCNLTLQDVELVDADKNEIAYETQDGYYEISPMQKPMLATEPAVHNATAKGQIFTVNVNLNDVDRRWRLVGVQFRLTYSSDLLEVLNVTEGPFLGQFNQTPTQPYTWFGSFIRSDTYYGPHVLVGTLILPTEHGQYPGPFPQGNGTIATITFKAISQPTIEPQPPANSTLALLDTEMVNDLDEGQEIPHDVLSGLYQIASLKYPVASFTFTPSKPSAGQVTLFDASQSYDPDHAIQNYAWNFGDGQVKTTNSATTGHVYAELGTYNVTLTVTDIDGLTNTTSLLIDVGTFPPLALNLDVGSLHFRSETAEFNMLVTDFGEPVNTTRLEAKLFFNGSILQDLSSSIEHASTGLYRIPYTIPANAEAGTYTLMVEAEYYEVKGTGIKSFQISPTLTEKIIEIEGGIATIQSNIGTYQTELRNINATLTGLIVNSKGELLAKIDTSLGSITTSLNSINATITQIDGNTATLSTTLGDVKTKLDGIQSTATTTLYIASILSAITIILALAILILVRKK
jgi:PKD repeat protein